MKKIHRFTLILTLVLLVSSRFTSPALALPTNTFIVNSSASDADANPGNGICATAGGQCTLHAAIQEANADGVYSTINFAQKFQNTNDIYGCDLPTITEDGTTIDASNQWDTTYHRPGVEIIGLDCALLTLSANNTMILGLLFGGGAVGVAVYGSLNDIGGNLPGQRNMFLTSVGGVHIGNGTSNGITNNYFGTIDGSYAYSSGTDAIGILVQGGVYTSISNNLIVGWTKCGIQLMTDNNVVANNIIGMSWNKSAALPNKVGILLNHDHNIIGPGNVIAGNTSHGLYLYHADNSDIKGNYIGYGYAGIGNGGDGIHLRVSNNNRITEGNVIANNTGNGIYAYSSSDITIQGSYVDSNGQAGIHFKECNSSLIGGGADYRNSIGGNQSHGIRLETSSAITVTSNYIGLRNGAFEWGNLGHGILVDNGSTDNNIGGSAILNGEANWIGWNHGTGVLLYGSATHDNYVVGNVMGAPINWGWEAPNYNHGVGIYNGAHDNSIGLDGFRTGSGRNIILASGWSGVAIVDSNDNAVLSNQIGTHNTTQWGNTFYGVTVSGSGNSIKGNDIAYNGYDKRLPDKAQAGVLVDGVAAIDNMITSNSIHDNDGPGIRLDNSGNHNLAAPVITNASCSLVQGTACPDCLVEIYSDDSDEGRTYEGSTTAPRKGGFTWKGTLHGPNVTALVIGPVGSMDTSPFSASFSVGVCP